MSKKISHVIKVLLQPIMLKIKQGPLAGKKWSLTAGTRFIKGDYEIFKTSALLKNLKKGDVFLDVGAHVGYYTAIASLVVGPLGKVIAFEPRPLNIRFFKRHMCCNGLDNIVLVEKAVGQSTGKACFETRTGTGTGRLSDDGDIAVDVVSLDELFIQGLIPKPDFIKIDVEGGEISVLKGAVKVIKTLRPILLIATHGQDKHAYVTDFLAEYGYLFEVLNEGALKGDVEIIAIPNS